MVKVTTFQDRGAALFGLGISGLSAARALAAGGADLVVYDDNEDRCKQALAEGFVVKDLRTADWSGFSALVLSPGVPLTHPEPHWTARLAGAANVPIIGDTELFFREFQARGGHDRVIVITGTNGKSTTTALTRHILSAAGEQAVMGGNIGTGVLDLPDFGSGTAYVLEMSSYQIDLTPSLAPSAAGLLNITPDHLDRHGTVEHYAEVKSRVFDQIGAGERAVVSIDDAYCRKIAAGLECLGEVLHVGSEGPLVAGALLQDDGFELYEEGSLEGRVALTSARALRGRHNAQNAAFAYLLALQITDNKERLLKGFESFPGLAHRAQEIADFKTAGQRVVFVNDSKATNAEAAAKALAAFPSIYWIAGGRAKDGGIESLKDNLAAVKRAFLIGEAAEAFADTLKEAGVAFEIAGTMEAATARAFEAAKNQCEGAIANEMGGEAVVLLSPAAASFDQYPNFEVRGAAFVAAVRGLDGVHFYDHAGG